jgi:acetyl esterase/lipase
MTPQTRTSPSTLPSYTGGVLIEPHLSETPVVNRILFATALSIGVIFSAVRAAEPLATATTTAASDIDFAANVVYGKGGDIDLHLDIARPADQNKPAPCVVLIHGGGWRMGDKAMHVMQVKRLAEQGYVAATVQYRLCPRYRFPSQVEDVKCAVRYLRAHADEYGIDKDRIGAVGFSAGAHLAMMLGAMDQSDGLEGEGGWPEESSKVQAVVSYFGPTDFRTGPVPERAAPLLNDFIGGTREERQSDWFAASPANYINSGDPPMLLFQGTNDSLVPYTQAMQMANEMAAAGVPGRVELIMKMGHGWGGPELERTEQATYEFLDQHLRK